MNDETEDIRARMEIARLHEVVRHLAFLVNVLTNYVDMSENIRKELKIQLDAIQEVNKK